MGSERDMENMEAMKGMEDMQGISTEPRKPMSRRDFFRAAGAFTVATFIPKGFYDFTESIEMGESFTESMEMDESFTESSRSYISDNPFDAEEIAKKIRCDRGASASNVCGPLAVSVLLGWRLNKKDGSVTNVSDSLTSGTRIEGIAPNDMWLGSPETDPNRYRNAFPPDEYDNFHITESIGTVDFSNIDGAGELKPGDFLYLDGGSFTHYIAVSRRDEMGRLYCVSNVPSSKKGEFEIKEVMLWDPNTMDGFFRNWASGVGPEKARTGLKGFYLWRRKQELRPLLQDNQSKELRDSLTNELREHPSISWHVHISELGEGQIFEWRNRIPYMDKAAVSLPILMIVLKKLQEEYNEDIQKNGVLNTLENVYVNGKSLDKHINNLLMGDYKYSVGLLYKFANLENGIKSLGLKNTQVMYGKTTQKDIYSCWEKIFCSDYLEPKVIQYLLALLDTGDREWRTDNYSNGVRRSGVIELDGGKRYVYVGMTAIPKSWDRNKDNYIEDVYCSIISKLSKKI